MIAVRIYPYTQRLLDIFAGLLGILALTLMLPLLWLANQLWAPGPLFYRQTRIGLRGHHFTMIVAQRMVASV